jgi:uncharacterized protein YcbX
VLSALYRYPVKSMRGQSLAASPVSPQGLPFDRNWMVADAPAVSSPGGPIPNWCGQGHARDDG